MKRLLIGPAGCGKTHQILDEFEKTLRSIADPLDRGFLFVVPSAEHVERIISQIFFRSPDESALAGFFHHRVTTFSRLAGEILGTGEENIASTNTRYLILRDILTQDTQGYFAPSLQSPGFPDLMLRFISELKESCVGPEIFRGRMNHLKRLEPDLAPKYEALASIYESYCQRLTAEGFIDRADSLTVYRKRMENKSLPSKRFQKIWIDGFFDFTPFQLEALKEVCELSEEVTVTLTKDSSKDRAALFEGIDHTETDLLAIGFKAEKVKAKHTRFSSPALNYLERNVFSEKKCPGGHTAPGGDIIIFEAVGVQGEVEMILREIRHLYAAGNYRFGDFAILLRQIGGYESVIRSLFAKYGIPLELHEREKLKLSGMIHTVVLLLKVFREGWKRADLICFLKSSYVQRVGEQKKIYEWIGELEHRAFKAGVVEGREQWLKPWLEKGSAFDEEKARVLGALAKVEDTLRASQTFGQLKKKLVEILYLDFGVLQIIDELSDWVKRDAASARRLEAILEEIRVHAFRKGQSEVPFDEFADEFFRLVELDLYPVHYEDKNRVQVYDISLARQKEYRVVFVGGLLEKHFPVQMKEDPVLSDWERALFNIEPPDLLERLPRQSLERYLFYIAATRAKEKLVLTYPRVDREGKEWLPSFYVDEVQTLFGGSVPLKKQSLSRPYPELDEVSMPRELEIALTGELWNSQITDRELLFELSRRQLLGGAFRQKFQRAVYQVDDRLTDPKIAAEDFFHTRQTSSTRLEEYAECHFRYFANRVMKLKDFDEDINIKQKGIIRHQVLEEFFKASLKTPSLLDKAKTKVFIEKEFERALNEHPLAREKKYQYELDVSDMKESLLIFLDKEIDRLKASVLKPRYFEFAFGINRQGKKPDSPALILKWNGHELLITGLIDRIDQDAEGKHGLVMDYKSSAAFSADKLDLGISLQLPVYLEVMEKYLGLKPVGGELYSIKDSKLSGFYHEKNTDGILTRKSSNKLSDQEYRATINKSMLYIQRFVDEMRGLSIEVKPRDCVRYCPFPAVCRIQKWKTPILLEEIKQADKKWLEALKAKGIQDEA